MRVTSENRLFIAVQWFILLALVASVVAWASVILPATVIFFCVVYFVLFAVGWTARAVVAVWRYLNRLF